LQIINQRIMSSSRLLEIISRFNLYAELRQKKTTDEIVAQMREDIKLDTISADVVDPRTRRPSTATIAFTLSYEGKSAQQVHQVANVLASLYLEENLHVREQQALGTSRFLEEEMQQLRARLAETEAGIAEFKEKHLNELPELLPINTQGLDRTAQEVKRVTDLIRTLRDREDYLQSQLTIMPPDSSQQDTRRLEELRVQLVHLKTRFSDEYPDVIKTRAEIAELEKQSESEKDSPGEGSGEASVPTSNPWENPLYTNLASQLKATQSEIASLRQQLADLNRNREEYRRRVEATPRVEERYRALLLQRDNTQAKFNDLMGKFMEASVAHGLEKDQKGERFTLIDPARLPEKPIKPNRLAILLIGIVLGVGAGVGTASLREFADHSVRTAEGLSAATAFPVLASIPEIITRRDVIRRRVWRVALAAGCFAVFAGGVVAFHYLVMDLDILWIKVSRRISLI
jgi:polysaccharide chain length determinant protein (PEP-CTERM system associated)